MLIRIALFAIPAVAAAGLTLLLNGLHADPGITVASLGLVAVLRGAQKQELYDFGYAAAEASFDARPSGVNTSAGRDAP